MRPFEIPGTERRKGPFEFIPDFIVWVNDMLRRFPLLYIVVTILLLVSIYQGMYGLADSIEKSIMYPAVISPDVELKGVYNPENKYYCVWTGDEDPYDIKNVDYHEMCHAYVDLEYEHFCINST